MNIGILKAALAALGHAVFTRPMLFWALRRAVKFSNTKVDDGALELIIAMDSGDVAAIQDAIKALADQWNPK